MRGEIELFGFSEGFEVTGFALECEDAPLVSRLHEVPRATVTGEACAVRARPPVETAVFHDGAPPMPARPHNPSKRGDVPKRIATAKRCTRASGTWSVDR